MIVTMYRRKWKFSVMSAEDAEDFIRQPHFERIRFISITEANAFVRSEQRKKLTMMIFPSGGKTSDKN